MQSELELKLMKCRPTFDAFFLRMLGVPIHNSTAPEATFKHLDVRKLISQTKNKAASRLMEALLLRTPPHFFAPLWTAIKPSFASLCLNPVANFAAQALVAAAPASRFVADMVALLAPNMDDLLLQGRSGVACVLATAAACWQEGRSTVCEAIQCTFEKGVRSSVLLTVYSADSLLPECKLADESSDGVWADQACSKSHGYLAVDEHIDASSRVGLQLGYSVSECLLGLFASLVTCCCTWGCVAELSVLLGNPFLGCSCGLSTRALSCNTQTLAVTLRGSTHGC
jgi:hypothetical protein